MRRQGHTSKFKSKGPELLIDLADKAAAVVKDMTTLDATRCDEIGEELARRMAFEWGGQNLYFPEGYHLKVSEHQLQIFQRFNGGNHAELAREFGVSLQHVYRVVKSVRQMEIAERQGALFPN